MTTEWLLRSIRSTQADRASDVIGIAAHERLLLKAGDETFHATKLELVAVARAWQGRRFGTGERASDVLMSGVLTDIQARVPPRHARVMAIVHDDNMRSLQLCRRHGFSDELSRAQNLPQYRRLLTGHLSL